MTTAVDAQGVTHQPGCPRVADGPLSSSGRGACVCTHQWTPSFDPRRVAPGRERDPPPPSPKVHVMEGIGAALTAAGERLGAAPGLAAEAFMEAFAGWSWPERVVYGLAAVGIGGQVALGFDVTMGVLRP